MARDVEMLVFDGILLYYRCIELLTGLNYPYWSWHTHWRNTTNVLSPHQWLSVWYRWTLVTTTWSVGTTLVLSLCVLSLCVCCLYVLSLCVCCLWQTRYEWYTHESVYGLRQTVSRSIVRFHRLSMDFYDLFFPSCVSTLSCFTTLVSVTTSWVSSLWTQSCTRGGHRSCRNTVSVCRRLLCVMWWKSDLQITTDR